MTDASDNEREERALDALIVLALRPELRPGLALAGPPPAQNRLSKADRRALAALGPDLAERVAAGAWPLPRRRRQPLPPKRGDRKLTGALNRAEEDGGLTEEARREMERKVRALEGEDGEVPPP